MAAALIRTLTGTQGNEDPVADAATDLRTLAAEGAEGPLRAITSDHGESGVGTALPPGAIPHVGVLTPADVPDLCRQVGDIPGADLSRLLAALAPDPAAAEQALRDLIAQAQAQAAAPPEPDPAPPG